MSQNHWHSFCPTLMQHYEQDTLMSYHFKATKNTEQTNTDYLKSNNIEDDYDWLLLVGGLQAKKVNEAIWQQIQN